MIRDTIANLKEAAKRIPSKLTEKRFIERKKHFLARDRPNMLRICVAIAVISATPLSSLLSLLPNKSSAVSVSCF